MGRVQRFSGWAVLTVACCSAAVVVLRLQGSSRSLKLEQAALLDEPSWNAGFRSLPELLPELRAFPAGPQSITSEGAFHGDGQGITVDVEHSVRSGGLGLMLPVRGEDSLVFALPGGAVVRVRELGLTGRAAETQGLFRYKNHLGYSLWGASAEGYEEWLFVNARGNAPVATWEITGAQLSVAGRRALLRNQEAGTLLVATAPHAYSEDGSEVEVWFESRGNLLELRTAAAGKLVIDPIWTATTSLSVARSHHTATKLLSGQVLVQSDEAGYAEVLDEASAAWSNTSYPRVASLRSYASAALFPSGTLYVVGGDVTDSTGAMRSLVYFPTNGFWIPVRAPNTVRANGQTLTTLKDGTMLLGGGVAPASSASLRSTELYTATTPGSEQEGSWASVGDMVKARSFHTASLLASGKVLVVGGDIDGSAEIYNPATKAWKAVASPRHWFSNHTATVLSDGRVLVVCGARDTSTSSAVTSAAEIFESFDGDLELDGVTEHRSVRRHGHPARLRRGARCRRLLRQLLPCFRRGTL